MTNEQYETLRRVIRAHDESLRRVLLVKEELRIAEATWEATLGLLHLLLDEKKT